MDQYKNSLSLIVLVAITCLISTTTWAQPDHFKFGMGIPSEPDLEYDNLPVKARLTTANYRAVDTRASLVKYAPSPKSQGQYGTCTAWAAGFCARTIVEAQRQGWTKQSTINDNAFSPGFIYRVTSPKTNCNGAYVSDCLKSLQEFGIAQLKDYNEDCPQTAIPKQIYKKAEAYKIKGYATLWNTNNPSTEKQRVQLVKKSIDEGNPVIIAMYVPNSFCYSKGPTWFPKSTDLAVGDQGHQHGRHAMCIVGYDDEQDGGAFRIQNSWGNAWADKGYIWVRYEDAAEFIYQAIELFKMPAIASKNETTKLAGALKLVEDTGQEMTASLNSSKAYQMNKAYRSGTRFRIYLNTYQPAYVYAIGSDNSNKIYQVFPHKKGVSPVLNYSENSVPIPSQDHHVRMDGNIGTDYLCVIYSKNPLNLEEIKRTVSQESSRYSFQEKVQRALGSQLMSNDNINYGIKDGKMSFTAEAKGKSIAVLFLQMEHID
ncbi:C1 family peptidase [Aureispira anguillae]|uniref:DUF4384 domain-containing protein n=1 Tax=Aureispira anguillae TaxID=2864201 RepID=A0A916DUQ0_9BACT|nr:C1 family peptidase [Aureispira anguillae]BDS13551.1 DUF4384 domain-containing protein [Aureispira anguillae]